LIICPNMNNFLDLQDIDSTIQVSMLLTSDQGTATVTVGKLVLFQGSVIGQVKLTCTIPLLDQVSVKVTHNNVYLESLKFDGWEARPQYGWEIDKVFVFETKQPFYHWLHAATGQGWLLVPQ
jgi:hypothetical protein